MMENKNKRLEIMVEEGFLDKCRKDFDEMKKINTAIVCGDAHAPYTDYKALCPMLSYINDIQPKIIILDGDMIDCYGISRFNKEPKRIDSFQEELDALDLVLRAFRKAAPKSRIVYLEGNHEHRLPKHLMNNSPGMYSLRALKPESLFNLKKHNVEWVSYDKQPFYLNANFIVIHGDGDTGGKTRANAGYSARGNLEKLNISGASGHVHRMGMTSKTCIGGFYQWYEVGCLCDLKPDYVNNPDWQQGFLTVYHTENRFHVVPHTIINGQFIANGRLYK